VASKEELLIEEIKKKLERFTPSVRVTEVGTVIQIGDGVARISGLPSAKYNELLEFPGNVMGIALNSRKRK